MRMSSPFAYLLGTLHSNNNINNKNGRPTKSNRLNINESMNLLRNEYVGCVFRSPSLLSHDRK